MEINEIILKAIEEDIIDGHLEKSGLTEEKQIIFKKGLLNSIVLDLIRFILEKAPESEVHELKDVINTLNNDQEKLLFFTEYLSKRHDLDSVIDSYIRTDLLDFMQEIKTALESA